jgi:hypothetical protein
MGYTHYWERAAVLPRPQFAAAARDCRQLCAALAVPLGDAGGQGRPTFNANEICFNGHLQSNKLGFVQQAQGLVWPAPGARGVAMAGTADAVVGGWGAGPVTRARVLGPGGDGSYETFRVERVSRPRFPSERPPGERWGGFCKTNYRPYDLCVQGCLIVLSHHLGLQHFTVSSDGNSREWDEARDDCQHVLGYGIDWGEGKLAPVTAGPPTAA